MRICCASPIWTWNRIVIRILPFGKEYNRQNKYLYSRQDYALLSLGYIILGWMTTEEGGNENLRT